MALVVQNEIDAIDRMVETARVVESIIARSDRAQKPRSLEAVGHLAQAIDHLTAARDACVNVR